MTNNNSKKNSSIFEHEIEENLLSQQDQEYISGNNKNQAQKSANQYSSESFATQELSQQDLEYVQAHEYE